MVVLGKSNSILSSSGGLTVLSGGVSVLLDINGFGSTSLLGRLKTTTTCSSASKTASPSMSTDKLAEGVKTFGG